jgi:hypothetical protein
VKRTRNCGLHNQHHPACEPGRLRSRATPLRAPPSSYPRPTRGLARPVARYLPRRRISRNAYRKHAARWHGNPAHGKKTHAETRTAGPSAAPCRARRRIDAEATRRCLRPPAACHPLPPRPTTGPCMRPADRAMKIHLILRRTRRRMHAVEAASR